MTGRQQDTARSLPYPDDVTSRWCTEDAFLADQQLLDTIGSSNLGDQLGNLRVPIPAVTADDES
jgi:hypothetical protein